MVLCWLIFCEVNGEARDMHFSAFINIIVIIIIIIVVIVVIYICLPVLD